MTPRFIFIILLFSFSILISCGTRENDSAIVRKPGKEDMEELNRNFIQKDKERIQNYIERKKLNMIETPTGLWYKVNEEGTGDFFADGDHINMKYDCYLLDGTLCYSSEKTFILGKTGIEAGLYEGMKMLRPGSEAIFILPPFLAYGLLGDNNKIPPRSVIVYYVKVMETQ
ncbi:MAG TPA: FKBP-type peptidyl-prolyl cis-trans isomerase [Bacteroidales bacterium]|nr:FKBP-type peptidyl-prolyl cis-trans isomerase [Bacteroidales bacterium]